MSLTVRPVCCAKKNLPNWSRCGVGGYGSGIAWVWHLYGVGLGMGWVWLRYGLGLRDVHMEVQEAPHLGESNPQRDRGRVQPASCLTDVRHVQPHADSADGNSETLTLSYNAAYQQLLLFVFGRSKACPFAPPPPKCRGRAGEGAIITPHMTMPQPDLSLPPTTASAVLPIP